MNFVFIYRTPTFVVEKYFDGVCVLLRDGEPPFYAENISWFDSWGDEIDLKQIDPIVVERPAISVVARTLPHGFRVFPVCFDTEGEQDAHYRWGFAVEDPYGGLTVTNLFGEVLYPPVENGYCLSNTPKIQMMALLYRDGRKLPTLVPPYVARALEHMIWNPLVMGIPETCSLATYQI